MDYTGDVFYGDAKLKSAPERVIRVATMPFLIVDNGKPDYLGVPNSAPVELVKQVFKLTTTGASFVPIIRKASFSGGIATTTIVGTDADVTENISTALLIIRILRQQFTGQTGPKFKVQVTGKSEKNQDIYSSPLLINSGAINVATTVKMIPGSYANSRYNPTPLGLIKGNPLSQVTVTVENGSNGEGIETEFVSIAQETFWDFVKEWNLGLDRIA